MRLKMLKDRRDRILTGFKSSGRTSEKKRYALEPYVELILEHFRSTSSSDLAWIESLIEKEEELIHNSKTDVTISTEVDNQLSQ
ncbi:MAG: hypothetical protein M1288_00120 [Actinobacteria bacterium]|nr:hypothetical protein [Actinomycetota bacterium]